MADSILRPIFFPIVPDRNPRTLWGNHPVTLISSFVVTPPGRFSRSRTLSVLLPSRTPSAFADFAFLGALAALVATAAFLGLAVALALGLAPLALFWPLGAPFVGVVLRDFHRD